MPFHSLTVLIALPSLALAVSLSDFTPRVSNLPSACDTVYRSQISGCSASDFTSFGCSPGCISALQNLVPAVQLACSSAGVTGNNPVSAFLSGNGPFSLCPNAPSSAATSASSTSTSTTEQPTTTSQQAPTTTEQAPTTTSTPETTSTTSTAATTSSTSTSSDTTTSSTSTATSAKVSMKASTVATSSAMTTSLAAFGLGGSSSSPTSDGTTATSATSATGAAETTQRNSGGGSPFDTNSTGAASAIALPTVYLLFSTVIGAYIVLL